jgi:hypothetical protein
MIQREAVRGRLNGGRQASMSRPAARRHYTSTPRSQGSSARAPMFLLAAVAGDGGFSQLIIYTPRSQQDCADCPKKVLVVHKGYSGPLLPGGRKAANFPKSA